jgi:lysophospholipase L1-like esterase
MTMRSCVAVALISALACASGCGEAVNKPSQDAAKVSPSEAPREPAPLAETPVEKVSMARTQTVGALERMPALRRFFEALAGLEEGRAEGGVRIVHFGDSHTAADIQTATARRALQARFGDGGRGFVAIGKPWPTYLQENVRTGMTKGWAPDRGKPEKGRAPPDGMYGIGGAGIYSQTRGARAWLDITAKTSRAELAYLEQPGGGSLELYVDGARVETIATRGEHPASAFRAFEIPSGAAHQIEVRAAGDGPLRVFGVSLSRSEHGVVYDALGIDGARYATFLSWNEEHWAEQLRHRAPALVVLAYGTNEAGDGTSPQTFERQIVDALGRVARAAPSASCLLLGPPDRAMKRADGTWHTVPKVREIVAAERRVAEAAGCAFYDQFAAMGGEGSMAAWAKQLPQLGRSDRVHLTKTGYVELGSTFASDLLRAYATWQRESGRPSADRAAPGARPPKAGDERDTGGS